MGMQSRCLKCRGSNHNCLYCDGTGWINESLAAEPEHVEAAPAVPQVGYVSEVRDISAGPNCGICGAMMVLRAGEWKCLSCGNAREVAPAVQDGASEVERFNVVDVSMRRMMPAEHGLYVKWIDYHRLEAALTQAQAENKRITDTFARKKSYITV